MRALLCLLLFAPFFSFSQKIKTSEYDKFIKKYRIETNVVKIKTDFASALNIAFRSVDSTVFLILGGSGKYTGVVGADSKLIFLLSDDNTVEATSKGIQDYSISRYSNYFSHEYYISPQSVKKLETATVKSVRIYKSNGYVDADISERNAKDISNTSLVFLTEFDAKVK